MTRASHSPMRAIPVLIAFIFNVLLAGTLPMGVALGAHTDGPLVDPIGFPGSDNRTCGELDDDLGQSWDFEFKVNEGNPNGTFEQGDAGVEVTPNVPTDFSVTLATSNNTLTWSSNLPVLAVYVKGGPVGGNLYNYSALDFPVDHDNGLTVMGGQHGISHVSFCFDEPPLLPDVSISKTTSTPVISAGEVASYTVSVSNDGEGDATGVIITDALPSGVVWTESPDSSSCTVSDGVNLTCGPLTIAAASSFSVTVSGTTDGGECPSISNTASFTSDNAGSGDTAGTPTVISVNCPLIRIEKTPDEDPQNPGANDLAAGEAATFTITAYNDGAGIASGVSVTDDLPGSGWSVVAAQTTLTNCVVNNPGGDETLSCGPDSIGAGLSKHVTVTKATVHPVDCGELNNTANVTTGNDGTDSDSGNLDVLCALIRVEKTPDEGTPFTANDVSAGETATFVITVHNDGSGDANGVTVIDDLPETTNGWMIVAAGTTLTNCVVSEQPTVGQVLACGPDTIPAGGSLKVTLATETTNADCGSLDNSATASAANDGSDTDTGNIDVRCPHLTIEKTPDGEVINAGDEISFTITVINNGAGTALAVTLDDELPAGFAWAEDPDLAECAITLGDLHCDVGDLGPTESFSVTVSAQTAFADCAENAYVNTAVAGGANHADVDDTGDVLIQCPDLEVTKSPDGEVINAGDEISFEIVVTNHGPGTAYDVTLDDELPAGFAWAEDPDVAACAITDGSLHCDIGDLGDDATFSVTVSAPTASANCADNAHLNTAVAGAANHADVDDTGDVMVNCPDLEVTKTPDGELIDADDEISFEIVVTNHGPGTAYDVTLNDELPAGFAWAEDPDNAACAITDGALHCDIGDLGDDESFSVTVSAPTSADDCAENAYVNTAVAGAANHADVDETGDVRIDCPDLTVDKEQVDANGDATDEPVDAGETAYFAFTVTNLGPGAARDVVVTDTAPAGTTWTIVDDGGLDCESASEGDQQTITCSTDELGDGESATVLLAYKTSVDDCGMLNNSVVVEGSNEPAANTENNADEASIVVECPGLNIVKTADADPIDAGETASFTITFWNAGPGDAFDVLFEDQLPAGLAWHWEMLSEHDPDDCASSATDQGVVGISCTIHELAPSSMEDGVVIRVWAETDRSDCKVLVNEAFVDASNNPGPRLSASDEITVGCPTIGLQKENDAVGSVLPGTSVTYTLTLTVYDPIRDDGVAREVVVSDLLPIGIENPTDISDGGTYDAGNHEIVWELGDLPEGAYTLTYRATVADDVANGDELVNAAAAISPNSQCPDFDTLELECEDDSTVVVRVPTLVIDKAANVEVITISGPANAQVATPSVVTWTLTYTLTDGPVTNAVITDEIPAGLDYVGGSASHGGTFADGVVTWTFPMLVDSGSVTFQTAVDVETISRSAPTVNVAVISSDQTPEDEGRDDVRVVVEPPVLGGTPRPRPSVPDTALGIGPGGRPVTVPIELVAVLFVGSLGTLAFANVRAVRQRRR